MPAPSHLSALPAPDAAPVSQETRLKYVLKHFWLIYQPASEVRIGYADTQPEVLVADVAGGFFQQVRPYPPAPNFREWAGARVPFFFDDAPEAPLLALGVGRATIHADIVAAAFFLLSGWQEYFSDTRDQHGRFPYAASVQQQYGFVALPVVNYYFDVLKTAVEHVIGQPLRLRPWREGAPLAAFISHDIDNLRSAWKAPAKTALKQGQLLKFGRMLWQHLTQADTWDNLEAVADATAQYGAKSTFFVLPAHQSAADGTPNADYELRPQLCARFNMLQRQGHEVAYHGSIGTATDVSGLERERQAMQHKLRDLPNPPGLRFHYLRWDPRNTLQALEKAAVPYDSTLGFAEHYGFRQSYCHPFYPFNFVRGEASTVLEIPLQVMDATLHHPNYLRLTPAEILPALLPVFDKVAKFGGVVSVLWHNENFDPANEVTGPVQFHALMAALQQRGAAFLTGRQITDSFASGF